MFQTIFESHLMIAKSRIRRNGFLFVAIRRKPVYSIPPASTIMRMIAS